MASDYSELSRRVKHAGLLRRRSAYYAAKIASTAVLLAAGWTAFLLLGDSWWQLVTAVFLAFALPRSPSSGMTPATGRSSVPGGPTAWSAWSSATSSSG